MFVFTFDGLLIFYFVLCVFNAPAAPAAAGAAIAASVASASSSCYGGGVSRWMVVDGLHVCTYIYMYIYMHTFIAYSFFKYICLEF